LTLGVAVALFHRSSFAYFWITLGMFLGVALGLGLDATLRLLPSERGKRILLWASWVTLVVLWLPVVPQTLADRQAAQRDSYAFIQRNFSRTDAGMQLEGGLFCHAGDEPLPVVMHTHVQNFFHGPRGEQRVRWLENEFRRRPIKYILGAHTLRLLPWPDEATRIWHDHFVPYYGAVMVPGRALSGPAGRRVHFEVWVPGSYRWEVDGDAELTLDGEPVDPARPVTLAVGTHAIELKRATRGALVWNLAEPARPDPRLTFYGPYQRAEIAVLQDDP
jgi:hypothetical protein